MIDPKSNYFKKEYPKNDKVNKPLLNMNISYDFKKAKELNNDISGKLSDGSMMMMKPNYLLLKRDQR